MPTKKTATEATKKAAPKAAEAKKAPAKKTDEITEDALRGKGRFQIKRAADGRYMFNIHAGNKQIVATSQMYTTMRACRNGIDSVGANASIAHVEDQTLATINAEKLPKFQLYTDKSGKYRFNLLAKNGNNILSCTQGYTHKSSCKNGIESVIKNAHAMIVLPEDDDD